MKSSKMKSFFAAALAASLVVTLAAGCSGKSSSSTATSSTSSTPAKLSGSVDFISWNNSETAAEAGAKQFMKENPGTTVTITKVADDTKLYTELAAGSGVPDIMQFQNRDTETALAKYPGSFADISDIMKPEEPNLLSAVLPLCQLNGKYYAVPWDMAPAELFYRKDIFKTAGVDPNSLKTWDDFITASKKILTSTGGKVKTFGFDYNGASSFDMPLILFYEQGGSFYDKNGKVDFDSSAMKSSYAEVTKMINAGITMNLPNEWSDRLTAIENNTLAAVPYGIWFTGTLEDNVKDQSGKWGMVPLPAVTPGGNNQANSGGSTVMLYSKSKNLPLAKAFTKWFLMSNEGSDINLTAGGLFDAYTPAYSDTAYSATDPYFGISTMQFAQSVSAKIPALPFPAYFTDVGVTFQNEGIGQYFVKHQDIDTVLKNASADAQKQVDNLQ